MPQLWADGLWAPGLWADGLWDDGSGGAVAGTLAVYVGTLTLEPGGKGVIYKDSTNAVTLSALQDELSGAYNETATVTLALLNDAGVAVAGAEAITMPHVAGTTGASVAYRGELSEDITATLTERGKYRVKVTATDADDNVRVFTQDVMALPG